jgi:DNA-directed RNA polymerase specialized sigma24 family protein
MLEHPAVFVRFSRCRRSLYFIARRVLGSAEGVEEAVQNCLLVASRNPPMFENEGAFRSWLLRILIDETLLILRRKGAHRESRPNRSCHKGARSRRETSAWGK